MSSRRPDHGRRADVAGGSSYDGLVALEAAAHDEVLLTLDVRAKATYQRLGARFAVIADWPHS